MKYLAQVKPQVSDILRTDEMFLRIKGNKKYIYALLDNETRFLIAKEVADDKLSHEASQYASELFRRWQEVTGKKPLTLITVGSHAQHVAYEREFQAHQKPATRHAEHIT